MMAPDWLHEAANAERWRDEDWGRWERLRDRLEDLGIEAVTPTADGTALRASGREVVDFTEALVKHDERPFLEALHRLTDRLGDHLQRRRKAGG